MKTFGELKIGDPVYFFAEDVWNWKEKVIKECPVSDIRRGLDGKSYVIDVITKEPDYTVSLFEKDLNISRSSFSGYYFSDLELAKEEVRKIIDLKQQRVMDQIDKLQKEVERLTSIKNKLEKIVI